MPAPSRKRGQSVQTTQHSQPGGKKKADIYSEHLYYVKTLFVTQAKQLIRLFSADLTEMVNGLIKINQNFDVDYSFIDKVLTHMVGLNKAELLDALKLADTPKDIKDKVYQRVNSMDFDNMNDVYNDMPPKLHSKSNLEVYGQSSSQESIQNHEGDVAAGENGERDPKKSKTRNQLQQAHHNTFNP